MRRFSGYALMMTAFIACPCHLVFLLPLALTLLGGTALGTFLTARPELVFVAALVYFLVALAAGFALLNRRSGRQLDSRAGFSCSVKKENSLL